MAAKKKKKKAAPAKKKPAKSTASLAAKMYIKGGTVLLLQAPAGAAALLKGPAKVVSTHAGAAETVVGFVSDLAAVDDVVKHAKGHLAPTSRLWLCYKKGDKALHRDTLWKALEPHGFEGNRLISFDDTWSAMHFSTKR